MVNSEQFANRLQKILEFYDISAATFAESIEVGRSSISHILSGRNKPSLDFVMKVVQNYPEVELYWLLNGKGNFPPSGKKEPERKVEKNIDPNTSISRHSEDLEITKNLDNIQSQANEKGNKIKRIILLYEDGSFESFENGNLV